jgi:ArsR family transcriptional regulator, lead/cadmium/zinc/bismuth-responsive transcriptional repressor
MSRPSNAVRCEVSYVHKVQVAAARRAIHDSTTLQGLRETFMLLGDVTRLKICLALAREELCVCDIAALLSLSESAVSHQLRLLRAMRLVRYWKEGKMVYYRLDDKHIEQLIRLGVEHVSEAL